jgi:molybdenum cofactor cytidylyltransferase
MYRRSVDGRPLTLGTIVLAAGAGSRFGPLPGAKLLAEIDGEAMLARVLGEVRRFGPAVTVVVLGHGADDIERALEWRDEIRVRNHDPDRGLSSSIQVGVDTLRALPDPLDGAFIVLGDQPLLRADVMGALAAAAGRARPADRAAVVPRYDAAGPRNPVLLLRPAWSWVDGLEGDRGVGRLIEGNPDQVLEVSVPGRMPDVDRPADLDRLGS